MFLDLAEMHESGADLGAYQASVAITACKFQDDPHNQKITHSSFEEHAHNSTHMKDRLLLASARSAVTKTGDFVFLNGVASLVCSRL